MPTWLWYLAAVWLSCFVVFVLACITAPKDTDIWPGGNPDD